MNSKYELAVPFIEGVKNVLAQFGIEDIKYGEVFIKDKLSSNYPVLVIIGIIGDLRGNITYNMDIKTAKNIASTMMMGLEIEKFDDMAKSAISEISNMMVGNAGILFEKIGKVIDISTPTIVKGKNIISWISQVETMAVNVNTNLGNIEINIGLEI